jgi:DNA-binding IclR family transcriptional regulator
MTDERDSGDQGLGPVSRGIVLLSMLGHRPHTIGDLHGATGLPKATIHRLLAQLIDIRVVVQDPSTEIYMLGPAALRLAHTLLGDPSWSIASYALPDLRQLQADTRETAALHISIGRERLCIAEVPSTDPIRYIAGVGLTVPIYIGSAGKILLAGLTPAEAERILAVSTDDPETIRRVSREVAEARERGWAESAGERVPGAAAVSVPVRVDDAGGYAEDDAGGYIASLSVLGPADRLPPGRRRELAAVLQETAERIGRGSAHKTHPPPSPPMQNFER